MFEEHRKYSHCILCGHVGLTKEHIFGKSLASKLGVKVPWTATAVSTRPRIHASPLTGSAPITNLAPRLLCTTCNSKRLSQLMHESLPILWAVICGDRKTLDRASVAVMNRYFERLALIVDVATSDHQMTHKHKESPEFQRTDVNRVAEPILSQPMRNEWLLGGSLSAVHTYVGSHEGVLGLNPDMCIFHLRLRAESDDSIVHYGKRISLVIGKLAVCIDVNLPRVPIPSSFRRLDVNSLSWPPDDSVTYGEYLSLRAQEPDVRHLRAILAHPQTCADIEQLSRSVGYFKLPFEIA